MPEPAHACIRRAPARVLELKQLLSIEQIVFLEAQRVGHLGTVDATGQPHVVPVCFAWLDGVLFTPIDEKPKTADPLALRRVRNLQANPAVCLTVDHYEEDWRHLAWLQVRGHAEIVAEPATHLASIAALRARYPHYRAMDLESRPMIRITPERVVEWRANPR